MALPAVLTRLLYWSLLPGALAAEAPLPVDLSPTLQTPLIERSRKKIDIRGQVLPSHDQVWVRVTTPRGESFTNSVRVTNGSFQIDFPQDFRKAPKLSTGSYFVDASPRPDFSAAALPSEIHLLVVEPKYLPDLPGAFTTDLLDRKGRVDEKSHEWEATVGLVNLYMRSRGARVVRVGRPDFNLRNSADLAYFKNSLGLYEFDYRDRDWGTPLGQRPARHLWQAVWDTWFNSSNNHPTDGNPQNNHPTNYVPYCFANDFSDLLIAHLYRTRGGQPLEDNLLQQIREGCRNLVALQHRGPDNFALSEASGKRETYTAGAFRYGLFENGDFLTEGKGWFWRPQHRDFEAGGVFNGRSLWAVGEAIRFDPRSPVRPELEKTLSLGLKYCLQDGLARRYTKRSRPGRHLYWRDAGEHAYLVLGMVAACEQVPELKIHLSETNIVSLRDLTIQSLNALVDLERDRSFWSQYPNVDAMAIAALAEGSLRFPDFPDSVRWKSCARRAAWGWMNATVDPKERAVPIPHFGLRPSPEKMTFIWPHAPQLQIHFYIQGHWIHALAALYEATGEPAFRQRSESIIRYLFGDNPWRIRLFNETGGVYNWTDDFSRDGIEDFLRQDMYPESTAFCQIGILRYHLSLRPTRSP